MRARAGDVLPVIYLARHGETAWSLTGQHTGLTDIPLTERGERNARRLGERLSGLTFAEVFTSPLKRTTRTCELAGLAPAVVDPDLVEWNYGEYEGATTAEIWRQRPDWDLWADGGPGGETPDQVAARVERVLHRVQPLLVAGDVALIGHGHCLRVLGARWIALPPSGGALLRLDTGTLSVLGHERHRRVLHSWNAAVS